MAATNRRPRGFNREDRGRIDALGVLNIAKEKFEPDPQHIYLTGHSMGGHGTWFLDAIRHWIYSKRLHYFIFFPAIFVTIFS